MSRHHHQRRAEQMSNKARGPERFQHESGQDLRRESAGTKDIQVKTAILDSFIHPWAYQIHREKRESAFDNWTEAE
ncbi:MAG: hypothetical protein WC552_03950 [Candidatus Omnitrophota bacterium]